MKYELLGSNDFNNVKYTILKNRGVKDIEGYLNLGSNSLYEYNLLSNINEGILMLKKTIENNKPIYIIVDCDVDGYSSASCLYDYIVNNINYKNTKYVLQMGKQHGLSKDIMNVLLNSPEGLIILPDAGTNDTNECEQLKNMGFEILVIDHHQKETDNDCATIINNQTCDYPNKNLCGVGIVYKFLQALDDEYWLNNADDYTDIVALGNVSDVMDLKECETKYLVELGLRNISHPLFQAFLNKQSFSIKNTEAPSIMDVAFYITPLMNAMIRLGTQEEKELLFRAFIKDYEEFEYTPRKSKNNPEPKTIIETIYERVARLCGNAKAKQSRIQEKAVKEIVSIYDEQNKENSICFINATKIESVPNEITGLVAIKIASMYEKPCLVLRKDKSKSTEDKIVFSGSARNINNGSIEDLKEELNKSNYFEMLIGHSNAFGVSILKENIPQAIKYFNDTYANTEKTYKVDFVFEENIDYKIIKDINSMGKLFSSFVQEPMIAINNVNVDLLGFEQFGNDDKKHWHFQNGVIEYIKFNVPSNDELLNIDTFMYSNVLINVIGKVTINTFGGKSKPQVIIEDYEIINKE